MERCPDPGFESYDRFFPSQDTIPLGGFGKAWRNERVRVPVHAYVRMSFTPGEAYKFDWSWPRLPYRRCGVVCARAGSGDANAEDKIVQVPS